MSEESNSWDAVHTVHDFWDGPVVGVADLGGRPHAFSRIFDPELDEWSEEYWLSPITDAQLLLVKEDWERWQRWETAFHSQSLGPDDAHPVLAVDRQEHERFRSLVEDALNVKAPTALRKRGRFDMLRTEWKVQWTTAD